MQVWVRGSSSENSEVSPTKDPRGEKSIFVQFGLDALDRPERHEPKRGNISLPTPTHQKLPRSVETVRGGDPRR